MPKSCLKNGHEVEPKVGYVPPPCYCTPASSPELWQNRKRLISFGNIEVREHAYILGDNPSVSDGAPLSISWKCQKKRLYKVDYYETCFPSKYRRNQKDSSLKLGVSKRAEILLTSGYSMADLLERTLEVAKTKTLRRDSLRNRKWDSIHEKIETTTRKIRKAARRSSLVSTGNNHLHYSPGVGNSSNNSNTFEAPESPSQRPKSNVFSLWSPTHRQRQRIIVVPTFHRDIDLAPRIDGALTA